MMNPLLRGRFRHQPSVAGREVAMAKRDHAVRIERAAPHRTSLGPAFGRHGEALEEPLGHPQVMNGERQVHVEVVVGHAIERMRAKLDGCLTGSQLAKDRAAEALTKVMIPAALDYPA